MLVRMDKYPARIFSEELGLWLWRRSDEGSHTKGAVLLNFPPLPPRNRQPQALTVISAFTQAPASKLAWTVNVLEATTNYTWRQISPKQPKSSPNLEY